MKSKNSNFAGFTIIELLFVIVIIGMLMVISIAVFQSHLRKGRDSFRKSVIDTIATTLKLDRINKNQEVFDLSKAQVKLILKSNSSNTIYPTAGHNYFYGYSANKSDFFVVVCGEGDMGFFVGGTPSGILAARSADPVYVCDGSSVPIKERVSPLNVNASPTNLDAYTVYELI